MANITSEMIFAGKLVEEVPSPYGAANTFDYSLPDYTIVGGATTSPVITQVWAGTLALTAGALTVALTTLARTGRTALDLTNLRVLGYRVDNLGTAAITLAAGGTNGYAIDVVVGAGGYAQQWNPAGFGTVDATHLNIDASGTGTDTFRLALYAGTV